METIPQFVHRRLGCKIDVAAALGSGLSALDEKNASLDSIAMDEIPGYPRPSIEGHAGRMSLIRIADKNVLLFLGRLHGYEGHDERTLRLAPSIAAECGVKVFIVANAAGALNPQLRLGELMLIRDVLVTPLSLGMGAGLKNMEQPRTSHRSIIRMDVLLSELLLSIALEQHIPMREGVYTYVSGPSYETKAEIAMLRMAGADAVGMSTVPEIIGAQENAMRCVGVSCITNQPRTVKNPVFHKDVVAVATLNAAVLSLVLTEFIRRLPLS